MFISMGGIPGAGKTTIATNLVKKLNNSGLRSKNVVGLPILCELAGGVSPEDFRRYPEYVRRRYEPEMWRIIYEEDKKDFSTIRVLDGHFISFEAGDKKSSIKKINKEDYEQVKAIFIITSTPENILERRKKDHSKRSDRVLDLNYIKEQLEMEKNEAILQAKELGVPVYFINNDTNPENAVWEMYVKTREILKLPNENREIKLH